MFIKHINQTCSGGPLTSQTQNILLPFGTSNQPHTTQTLVNQTYQSLQTCCGWPSRRSESSAPMPGSCNFKNILYVIYIVRSIKYYMYRICITKIQPILLPRSSKSYYQDLANPTPKICNYFPSLTKSQPQVVVVPQCHLKILQNFLMKISDLTMHCNEE